MKGPVPSLPGLSGLSSLPGLSSRATYQEQRILQTLNLGVQETVVVSHSGKKNHLGVLKSVSLGAMI